MQGTFTLAGPGSGCSAGHDLYKCGSHEFRWSQNPQARSKRGSVQCLSGEGVSIVVHKRVILLRSIGTIFRFEKNKLQNVIFVVLMGMAAGLSLARDFVLAAILSPPTYAVYSSNMGLGVSRTD